MSSKSDVIAAAGVGELSSHRELTERIIFWLFVAGLAWVPFWYGSNDWIAWGANAILFSGLTGLYEISLLVRRKEHPVGVRTLALPVALFAATVLWIAFQTLTLRHSVLVNPIWKMAADALEHPLRGSISVNRDLTNLALMRLLTAASVFWLALQLCRSGPRGIQLIASVGAIGCGYAAYGLVAAKFGPLPWLRYLPSSRSEVSSTFIDPDSYATYAGLGLMAMAGLILRLYHGGLTYLAGSWRIRAASFIESTGGQGAVLLAGGFLLLVALLLTGSRGGVMSAGLGLFVLGVLARQAGREGGKEPLALLAFGFLVVAVTLFGFGGVVTSKLDSAGLYDANRMAVYQLTLRSIWNLPSLGWGYGTFADVFPMYRDRSIPVLGTWAQAHDTYLEIFQGLGLVFGTMLILCVLLLVLRCVRGAMHRQQNLVVPRVAASAAFLVAAHALVDFSLQMQAVAVTFSALLGCGVAQSYSSRLGTED